MKKHYFIFSAIACLFIAQSKAQTLTATGSNPTVGETFNYFNTSYFAPGGSGSGQTWNFSTISGSAAASTTVAVGSTPNGSSFSAANVGFDHGGGVYGYQKTSSTANQNYGFDAAGTIIAYNDPEDQMRYPFSLNDTYTDSWSSVFVSGGYTFYRTGTTTVTADGAGTLITPSGTITNVLRVHFYQAFMDSANIAGNPYIITYTNDEYFWYKDGAHFALAATYQTTNSAGAPGSGGSYLTTTLGIENATLENSFELFPNPANDNIQVAFTLDNPTSLQLSVQNITGQIVYSEEIVNFGSGENKLTIDVKDFEKGAYFVSLKSEEGVLTRKIIVQ